MLALLLADVPAPSPRVCAGADPALTSLTSQMLKQRDGSDHYVVTVTVTNVGPQNQTPDITQRVELVRDGVASAPQTLPALRADLSYKLAFAINRPAAQRSQPLTVTVRYRLVDGDVGQNACNRSNDELTKTL